MDETIKIYTADVNLSPNNISFTKPFLILYSETKGYLFIRKDLFVIYFEDCISIEDLAKTYDLKIENIKEFKKW